MEAQIKILICGNFHKSGLEIFHAASKFSVDHRPNVSLLELQQIISEYDALVIDGDIKIVSSTIQKGQNLKLIVRAGTGLDNLDVHEATRKGIMVMNTPGINAVATAEHTISLIMAAHRHIPQAVASMKAGLWEKKKFQGREIAARKLGIIGLGRIGSMVARLAAKGLGMEVLGYDPAVTNRAAAQMGVTPVTLPELIKMSDVISVHVPLTSKTMGLLGPEEFQQMKPGMILVNCSKTEVIDEKALGEAVENGIIACAALDLFESSPILNSELIKNPKLIVTPHLGASTQEAQIGVAVAVAEQIIDYFEHGTIRNAVNVPSVPEGLKQKMLPYLDLARRLGHFLGQYSKKGITELEIEYNGDFGTELQPITNSAIVGLMSIFQSNELNLVNASLIAEERGIKVFETTLKEVLTHGPYLELKAKTEVGTVYSVQGALIRRMGFEPRITGIGDFVTEAVPAGPMLIVSNKDKPGMIAGMTACLANKGINIAQMNLSRDCIGGSAMSIINIDTPANDTILQEISNIDGIINVTQIVLDS
jgi:D-3-phosphoglycerate dehydrogenase / 2-oxoglutarate reductase